MISEREGCEILVRAFRARGYRIEPDVRFREGGVDAEFDGWDASARVGFEYLVRSEGDHDDLTPAEMNELAARMERDELYVLIIDEASEADALRFAAAGFLDEVARRRGLPVPSHARAKATGAKATGAKATGAKATGARATGAKAKGARTNVKKAKGARRNVKKATPALARTAKAVGARATSPRAAGTNATAAKAKTARAKGKNAKTARAKSKKAAGAKSKPAKATRATAKRAKKQARR